MMIKETFHASRPLAKRQADRILTGCGWFLLACELYKQLFLYYIINHGNYDWWFFPFQLCSLPMYLCLILPLVPEGRTRTVLCTFMQDFGMLGGIAALIVSDGFRHIHWSLTVHGYLWHVLLILISLVILLSGQSDLSRRGYVRVLPFFALCCLAATLINLAAPGHGTADMFYISPYHPSSQPLIHDIAVKYGILTGHLTYLTAVCIGGFLVHETLAFLYAYRAGKHSQKKQRDCSHP